MKKSIKSIVVLVCICAVVSVLLALTNYITEPIIRENEQKKTTEALLEVLPEGGNFDAMDISSYTLPKTVTEVYRASNGGYVIKMSTSGYASGMVLLCGVTPNGTIAGAKLLSSSETPSIGGAAAEKFAPTVVGKDVTNIDGVDIIAGATKTTEGYRNAMKDALNAAIILGGGEVDLRTEEEILADNLDAALPAAGREFEKHFFVEIVEGVDAIYVAKNNTGAVCVIGEQFIGLDADNTVLTDCSAEDAAAAIAAMEAIGATETTELDLTQFTGLPSQLVWAKKTASGNYYVRIRGVGYGIQMKNDPYHPASGEYIIIDVSMTADGRIIDCLTVSQAETDGIGSACADEKFYGQFDGKTETNYTEIDAIGRATYTTNGYKQAILRVFESVKIFEEDNQA